MCIYTVMEIAVFFVAPQVSGQTRSPGQGWPIRCPPCWPTICTWRCRSGARTSSAPRTRCSSSWSCCTTSPGAQHSLVPPASCPSFLIPFWADRRWFFGWRSVGQNSATQRSRRVWFAYGAGFARSEPAASWLSATSHISHMSRQMPLEIAARRANKTSLGVAHFD